MFFDWLCVSATRKDEKAKTEIVKINVTVTKLYYIIYISSAKEKKQITATQKALKKAQPTCMIFFLQKYHGYRIQW